jgi:hypothetical protein
MDEFSWDPVQQGRAACAYFGAGGFPHGHLPSGVGGGVRKLLEKAHCIEEPVGRQGKESSAGNRLMVNL